MDFADDDSCLEYLWREHFSQDGATTQCPRCSASRQFRRVTAQRSYRCGNCGYYLHPTAGTLLHRSSTPLHVWFRAIVLVAANDELTAKDLERELDVTYKTAWRMLRLIRSALESSDGDGPTGDAAVAVVTRPPRPDGAPTASPRRRRVPAPGVIVTFAGDGTPAYGGDGDHAARAQLVRPWDVAVDSSGNVFIVDEGAHVVRRVDAAGTIETVAGDGAPGYSGDGGPAVAARLKGPTGVALDDAGNLFIADHGNHVVRRIDPAGIISTIAGNGRAGFAGDRGPATAALLDRPGRLVASRDGLLLTDYGNDRVRRIDARGTIDTVAGTGRNTTTGDGGPATEAGVPKPSGLALDASGNLFVAQAGDLMTPDARVRRIDTMGTITTFAGQACAGFAGDGGPATAALLSAPADVAVDHRGNVLICDCHNSRIRRVDRAGTIATIVGFGLDAFGGNGGWALQACLNQPVAVALDGSGNLFIADRWNHRVRQVVAPIPASVPLGRVTAAL